MWGMSDQGARHYDRIGVSYASTRRADPRIAAAIHDALGDARTVLNVGAGAGNYEPADREVTALEPSPVMIAQRPTGAAPVVRGRAEELPFEDGSFDAVTAVLSDHHWSDRRRGLTECRRVSRGRVVLFNADPSEADRFWLTAEYLPEFLELIPPRYRTAGAWEASLRDALGPIEVIAVPVPHDCTDGFYGAYWRRPEVDRAVNALSADLETGRWQERHRELLMKDELHLGYYLITAETTPQTGGRR
jgi:SAM-dependent methyltransferase